MKTEQLAATIVHDLKNQLQALLDYEQQALNQIPAQYHEYLQPILQRTIRLKNDTFQMVMLYRMENMQGFSQDDAWPRDSLNEVLEGIRLQYPHLLCHNQIDSDTQGFYSESLVQLALTTLITNSAQAGATEVVITATDQNGLRIRIEDNGHGFEKSVLDGEKLTTKNEGSGLGLYFVRLIAEHHQQGETKGQLSYGNKPKKDGAFVELFLP